MDEKKLFCVELNEIETWYNKDKEERGEKITASAVAFTVQVDATIAEEYIVELMKDRTSSNFWQANLVQKIEDIMLYEEGLEGIASYLFCVKVFRVDPDNKEYIKDKIVICLIASELIEAQQLAIKYAQQEKQDGGWCIAEGQAIELVEGWLVKPVFDGNKWNVNLEPSLVLESKMHKEQEESNI